MFQILKTPNIDFMGKRTTLLIFSLVLVLGSIGILVVNGLNLGIEFAGGAELQLKFESPADLGEIRTMLKDGGIDNAVVTTIGDPEENEIYIRVAATGRETDSFDQIATVIGALRSGFGGDREGLADLNIADQTTLTRIFSRAPEVSDQQAKALAQAVVSHRKETAILHDVEELADAEGMTPELLEDLRANGFIGPFAVRSQSFIGPAIGKELMNKALGAVLGSLVGMLIYIWIRFQLEWGFAAVVALTHDTLITLGLFSLFGKEMSLPVVAAFLTLVGYSVNDTVVVFDRIRENLAARKGESLESVINASINQTLSRTIITSGLTWIVVFGLFVWGGAALSSFSFVLTVGVLVGTYSSIYVASPMLILWRHYVKGEDTAAAGGSSASGEAARATK